MQQIPPGRLKVGAFWKSDTQKVVVRMLPVTPFFTEARLIPIAVFMIPRVRRQAASEELVGINALKSMGMLRV